MNNYEGCNYNCYFSVPRKNAFKHNEVYLKKYALLNKLESIKLSLKKFRCIINTKKWDTFSIYKLIELIM